MECDSGTKRSVIAEQKLDTDTEDSWLQQGKWEGRKLGASWLVHTWRKRNGNGSAPLLSVRTRTLNGFDSSFFKRVVEVCIKKISSIFPDQYEILQTYSWCYFNRIDIICVWVKRTLTWDITNILMVQF